MFCTPVFRLHCWTQELWYATPSALAMCKRSPALTGLTQTFTGPINQWEMMRAERHLSFSSIRVLQFESEESLSVFVAELALFQVDADDFFVVTNEHAAIGECRSRPHDCSSPSD